MDDIPIQVPLNAKKFIPRLRLFIRKKGLSYSTEKTYIYWVVYFIRYHKMQHPEEMNSSHVEAFLSCLSIERHAVKKGGRGVQSPLDNL